MRKANIGDLQYIFLRCSYSACADSCPAFVFSACSPPSSCHGSRVLLRLLCRILRDLLFLELAAVKVEEAEGSG